MTATVVADHLWQTELFSSAPHPARAGVVSARAAYQDVLAGRAVLLDVRPADERARAGEAGVPVWVADPGVDLSDLAAVGRVHLLGGGDECVEPATLASFDPADPRVTPVDGGFAAWRAAGLPVRWWGRD